MFFEEVYIPRPNDYDRNNKLSYEALLHILEDTSSRHSAYVNDSLREASGNGIAWILAQWHVNMTRRIECGEKLFVTTWVRGKAPASAVYRDFIVKDEHGEVLVRAEAKFALFDLSTSRLTRIDEELMASYQPEEEILFDNMQRLRVPTEYEYEKEIALRRSDIDFNDHMHNTRYVDLAMEVLPEEVYKNVDFTNIYVSYKKPIMKEDKVTLRYTTNEMGHIITIMGNDAICALVMFN